MGQHRTNSITPRDTRAGVLVVGALRRIDDDPGTSEFPEMPPPLLRESISRALLIIHRLSDRSAQRSVLLPGITRIHKKKKKNKNTARIILLARVSSHARELDLERSRQFALVCRDRRGWGGEVRVSEQQGETGEGGKGERDTHSPRERTGEGPARRPVRDSALSAIPRPVRPTD